MKIVPLLDVEAVQNETSFFKEAELLNLEYGFKHINFEQCIKYKNIFITDRAALKYSHLLADKKLYLWIIEPYVVNPNIYKFAIENSSLFEKIFSHHKDIVNHINNSSTKTTCHWYPWGSYYIPLKEHKLYTKNKNVSIVCSAKKWTPGHIKRHACYEAIKTKLDGYKYGDPPEAKIKWHANYRYSIAVENCNIVGYFTEKIIDCFRTGTIPIYNGDPEILDYFNKDGIILFDEPDDLVSILETTNEQFYNERLSAIKENFDIAEKYLYPWKFITENYIL